MSYLGTQAPRYSTPVETSDINNQAVTAVKLSAGGGSEGQVLELDSNGNLKRIIEKPHKNHLTNIGLYLMCPNVMKLISGKKVLDMDQLIKLVKKQGKKIGVFPVSDENVCRQPGPCPLIQNQLQCCSHIICRYSLSGLNLLSEQT